MSSSPKTILCANGQINTSKPKTNHTSGSFGIRHTVKNGLFKFNIFISINFKLCLIGTGIGTISALFLKLQPMRYAWFNIKKK
ncbi:hypothetical protein LPB86_06235 [Pedobacter sp. MC2016-14]|uniref:hypothetical protein n=1 Tax=Pedobacter sp. MC2016-14 TaxID=2897327 RepID=UPI001E636859|nr:hypothetical protein [Pedobacter sp. MC2016-14]MCD0487817.1 hypothetical protein [Pedobacter sp. MC2016-14]